MHMRMRITTQHCGVAIGLINYFSVRATSQRFQGYTVARLFTFYRHWGAICGLFSKQKFILMSLLRLRAVTSPAAECACRTHAVVCMHAVRGQKVNCVQSRSIIVV